MGEGRPRPLVIGHRGAPVAAPENTLGSFRLAVEAGADILETDLWVTRDGVIVCHHDRSLSRVTDRSGAIPVLDLETVKQARVSRSEYGDFGGRLPGERVPTLGELLDATPPAVSLALELKDPAFASPERARLLLKQIGPRVAASSVMLLSFDAELLRAARAVEPGVWVYFLAEYQPHPSFDGYGVSTSWQAMKANPAYMEEARRQGLWVCPLDPVPGSRLSWYLSLGVDAVLSDDPGATRRALEAAAAQL